MSENPNTFGQDGARERWMAAIDPGAKQRVLSDNARAGASWLSTIGVTPGGGKPLPANQPTPVETVEIVLSNLVGSMNASAWAEEFVRINPHFTKAVAEKWFAKAIACGFSHAFWAAELDEMASFQDYIDANVTRPHG